MNDIIQASGKKFIRGHRKILHRKFVAFYHLFMKIAFVRKARFFILNTEVRNI